MKYPVKRLRQTIAIAIIFLVAYTAVMLGVEQHYNRELVMADSVNKTESVRGMIEGYGRSADEVGRGFCEDENARVRLAAIRFDINRALQSMAERELLQYAQSNITINLGDAAVNKADTSKTS